MPTPRNFNTLPVIAAVLAAAALPSIASIAASPCQKPLAIQSLSSFDCPSYAVACQNDTRTNEPFHQCCVALNGLAVFAQNWTAGAMQSPKFVNSSGSPNILTQLPKNAFTVHGLWPDYCNGAYNTTDAGCDPSRAYHDLQPRLESLLSHTDPAFLTSLKTYWQAANGDSNWMWSHEWTKHGTCHSQINPECYGDSYTPNKDVLDYFRVSMLLREQINVFKIFAKNGIVPSKQKTYTRAELNAALEKSMGFKGGMQCVTNDKGDSFLSEVWVYLLNLPGLAFQLASPALVTVGNGAFESCPGGDTGVYFWPNEDGIEV
ncbi:ribonuclease T2-like [Chytridiales sp. JEL 0842]|nr:ribonuclease T2-like [Chytridiales sp. JEL 0842]